MDDIPSFADHPALRHRLSTRIIVSSAVSLLVILCMIGWTLWLSWQLEGAGAAINDAGSLRMRANQVAVGLARLRVQDRDVAQSLVLRRLDEQSRILAQLRKGNPSRPLMLPDDPVVRVQMGQVIQLWDHTLAPAARSALASADLQPYLLLLPGFVHEADRLVGLIETDSAKKTFLLRLSQSILIVMACVGTLALIYLLYLWIIFPVLRLRDGLASMANRDFGARLPVERQDEFGELASGFNQMASELESLYSELERRVEEKTTQLARRNAALAALYDMAAFLSQPNDAETTCQGFLDRVMRQFDAGGGTVRTLDPGREHLSLVLSRGLSASHGDDEFCMKANDCFCGEATRAGTVMIRDVSRIRAPRNFHCLRDGFCSLAVFMIQAPDEVLGSFSLHFNQPRILTADERHLLETLGKHLGVALQSLRLIGKARQLAMEQERNLMAQGLHDSLAQGLNFLNLQLQLLEQAVQDGKSDEIREIVPLLRTGVTESYQDVRELLHNFRSRLGEGELLDAVRQTVERFAQQTGIPVALETNGLTSGASLTREQQLQVWFILQEALSNVRKHAQAGRVDVGLDDARDFRLTIRDDGVGYDPDAIPETAGAHLGRQIMRERAGRISAQLSMQSAPGKGTTISLVLPAAARQAA